MTEELDVCCLIATGSHIYIMENRVPHISVHRITIVMGVDNVAMFVVYYQIDRRILEMVAFGRFSRYFPISPAHFHIYLFVHIFTLITHQRKWNIARHGSTLKSLIITFI